jgi:hyaluronoglucosaminidase
MSRRLAALATTLLLAATGADARPAPTLRGVIEGYYGRPWTGDARRDVIRFLGAQGLDAFVYAPKNDEYHRERWRDPYPAATLDDLRATAVVARDSGVELVYALSPVLDVCYSCPADFRALTKKLRQLARARVRRFGLLFDDGGTIASDRDAKRYGGRDGAALGRAQGDLVRRTDAWLRGRGLPGLALVVPTEYAGTMCLPYHATLAARVPNRIPIGWTGPGVFAETITAAMAEARARCLPRHPVLLWDNYPVNDTVVSNSLHLGPLTGREARLPARLTGGYLLNPMTQPHASLVALGTAAAYLADPATYDPEAAWQATLAALDPGHDSLGIVAAQLRSSALDLRDARLLAAILDGVEGTYADPTWPLEVDVLAGEEARQAAAAADVSTRLGATPLGTEIAPWIAELAAHAGRGADAVRLLRALRPDATELVATPGPGTLRVQGRAVGPDAALAATLGPDFAAEGASVAARIASPPVGAFFACLGRVAGANIHFCPQFGLNVHGKRLYVVIRSTSDIQIVSDRNVHDRLVRFAGDTWTAWAAGRTDAANVVTATVDGATAPLDGEGRFDVTVPTVTGSATVLVSTAAGERTARVVP